MTSTTTQPEKAPSVFAWRSRHTLVIRGRRVDDVKGTLGKQRIGSWWSDGLRVRYRSGRITARIVETGKYGNHRPVFRARIEAHERESHLVGHIGWGTLNLQSVVFAALPIIGVWGVAFMISLALDRNEVLDWVFIPVFIGMTVMSGHLAWICGIERLLPASRIAEIEDLDDELRRALDARRY